VQQNAQQRQETAIVRQEQFIDDLFDRQRQFEQDLMTQFFQQQSELMQQTAASLLNGLRDLFQPQCMPFQKNLNNHGKGCQCPSSMCIIF
jgi:hypothetical protein